MENNKKIAKKSKKNHKKKRLFLLLRQPLKSKNTKKNDIKSITDFYSFRNPKSIYSVR